MTSRGPRVKETIIEQQQRAGIGAGQEERLIRAASESPDDLQVFEFPELGEEKQKPSLPVINPLAVTLELIGP